MELSFMNCQFDGIVLRISIYAEEPIEDVNDKQEPLL